MLLGIINNTREQNEYAREYKNCAGPIFSALHIDCITITVLIIFSEYQIAHIYFSHNN